MTPKQANGVYDLLVRDGGASESMRGEFISYHTSDVNCPEWRFGGKLGFGGKYYGRENRVGCYSEEDTKERRQLIDSINVKLKKIITQK